MHHSFVLTCLAVVACLVGVRFAAHAQPSTSAGDLKALKSIHVSEEEERFPTEALENGLKRSFGEIDALAPEMQLNSESLKVLNDLESSADVELKLHDDMSKDHLTHILGYWKTHVNYYNMLNDESPTTLLRTLKAQYEYTEVDKIIANEIEEEGTALIAVTGAPGLQPETTRWKALHDIVPSTNAKEFLERMSKDEAKDELRSLKRDVDNYNKKDANDQISLLQALEVKYDDEGADRIIAIAMGDDATTAGTSALKLQPTDEKHRLPAGRSNGQIIEILEDWKRKVELFNARNARSQFTLFRVLKANYGYQGVAKIIAVAKQRMSAKPTAVILESLWKQVDPDHQLAAIKGNTQNGDFLEHKDMLHWIYYMNDFNKEYPEKAKPLLDRLKQLDKDGDLVNVLFGPKEHPRRLPAVKLVLNALLRSAVHAKSTPAEFFKYLRLDEQQNNVIDFESQRFSEWMNFMGNFNRVGSKGEAPYIPALVSFYTAEGFMEMLEKAAGTPRIKRLVVDFRAYVEQTSRDHELLLRLRAVTDPIRLPPEPYKISFQFGKTTNTKV